MNQSDPIQPPKRFQQFFDWFCDPEFFEELQGDLEERFYDNVEIYGLRKAKSIYRKEVFMMIRPSVVRKISLPHLNYIPMFRNYTLVSFRNIVRNRLFSFINIIGLAISMAVGLLVISFLTEMYSYDDFHSKKSQIYRLTNSQIITGRDNSNYATTAPLTGRKLEEEYTGFEQIVYLNKGFWGDIKKGESIVEFSGLFASEAFFEMFDFELLHGSPENVLKEPYSTVITEEMAVKIFGETDVVGEVIQLNDNDQYTITGIAKNPPRKSHIRFDALGSFATLELKYKDNPSFWKWNNMWSNYIYLTIPDEQSLERVQQSLNLIAQEENDNNPLLSYDIEVGIQPLTDIFPGKRLNNQLGVRMDKSNIHSMIILALIVLFSACFNYTNLSLARALKRVREIGIRRTIGAKGREIFTQFTLEAVIITFFALIIAFCLFWVIRPEFISLNRMFRLTTLLELNAEVMTYFLLFGLGIGVIAGFVPALIFSQQKTVNILQGSKGAQMKGVGIRKAMIGLQFTLSIGFAILVTLAYKQYQFALNFDLGFQTENILNISSRDNDIDALAGKLPSFRRFRVSPTLRLCPVWECLPPTMEST
ncbi:MAG: ABC transporter permease [Bacteroidia bacterium]